jgi:hypothetical protein
LSSHEFKDLKILKSRLVNSALGEDEVWQKNGADVYLRREACGCSLCCDDMPRCQSRADMKKQAAINYTAAAAI